MKKQFLILLSFIFSCALSCLADNLVLEEGVHFKTDTMNLGRFIQLTVASPIDILLNTDVKKIKSVEIKPVSKNIQYKIEGNRIRLIGVNPCKVAITVNEDYSKPVYLFVNAPSPKAWENLPANTIRFKKGVHNIGEYNITADGTTLFLEEGSVLKGYIFAEKVKNVKILGYGIIDGRVPKHGIRFNNSSDVEIDGPIVLSLNGWSTSFFICNNLNIKNTKILSSEVYSDEIDLLGCSNVLIDDIFVRNEDDCITLKTKKYVFSGNVENVKIQNSVFWSGIKGNALEIGWELDGEYVKNITFENIDIIRKETSENKNKRAAISIHHVGNATISDILYKDIRIESVFENIIWLELIPANKWGSGGGKIENIKFENLEYLYGETSPIVIKGTTGKINNIQFLNLKNKGKLVKSSSDNIFDIENADVVVK